MFCFVYWIIFLHKNEQAAAKLLPEFPPRNLGENFGPSGSKGRDELLQHLPALETNRSGRWYLNKATIGCHAAVRAGMGFGSSLQAWALR